jgi:hypothetical protein
VSAVNLCLSLVGFGVASFATAGTVDSTTPTGSNTAAIIVAVATLVGAITSMIGGIAAVVIALRRRNVSDEVLLALLNKENVAHDEGEEEPDVQPVKRTPRKRQPRRRE